MSTTQQVQPSIDETALRKYATTFFGYGSWKADYWLVGLEERGATKRTDEFRRRYKAWHEMDCEGLVDLRRFCRKCSEGAPKSKWTFPDWRNPTWKALHGLLTEAGIDIGEMNENNKLWGGSVGVEEGSGHVALIEVMPFPSPSVSTWPYEKWDWDFMQKRALCGAEFREARIAKLLSRFENCKPKAVIDYSRAWKKFKQPEITFSRPVLYREAKINSSLWLAPVKIAGPILFDDVAKEQTAKQLSRWLAC